MNLPFSSSIVGVSRGVDKVEEPFFCWNMFLLLKNNNFICENEIICGVNLSFFHCWSRKLIKKFKSYNSVGVGKQLKFVISNLYDSV